ncbi:MAG TPA: ATP-binding cassette domain-containing protein [Hansschlegelia sp.]
MAAITLTDVTKIYRGEIATIRNVTLDVPDGAFCVLVGPTGCGKSTLLRLIAGSEELTSGLIEIGDAARQSWSGGRADVAELIDASALDPSRNVYDSLTRGLSSRGLPKREVEERALRAADMLALGSLLARKVGRTSSGERSLLALGRAFAHQPRALLFDEPFAGLDPVRRIAMRRELRRLQRTSRTTTLYATHDHEDGLALADLLVVLDEGRVLQAGGPAEIYAAPVTAAVASLVGHSAINLLPVRANQTGLSLEDGTHLGGASVMTTAVFATLGVRPEHLFAVTPSWEGPAPAATLPMMVDEVEHAGAVVIVHGRVGPYRVVARLAVAPQIPADGRLRLGARREHLHMFDAQSGARL